ncbi:hypothetical protein JCM33374_g872 [Metschnikowia sp. JCM 33374]|nr:hypothetical protein JCM33374_g872 [Metschnikowia sp. JCM 33374]
MVDFMPQAKELYFVNGINDPGKFGTKTPTGNARLYNCKQCKRAFTRYEHLSRHIMSTHNKLKPFACGICSRAFSRRDLLLRHAKNLHEGSELAVARIRKQLKKPSLEAKLEQYRLDDLVDGNKSDEGKSDENEYKSDGDKSDDEKSGENSPVSSPRTKRLKLSVDMLVS